VTPDADTPALSVVIPTFRRHDVLRQSLDRLERQRVPLSAFEVLVVQDAASGQEEELSAAVSGRPYDVHLLRADIHGASAARNRGWRAARAPIVLFLDDDVLAHPRLLEEHLAWHRRYPRETVGVLGSAHWARGLRVTPFMRWIEHGVQFDYPNIAGIEAGWGRFYTLNVSVKRRLLERTGGFDEEAFPFHYEDLELAYRMQKLGFRLLFNPRARVEHLHAVTVEDYARRMADVAPAERRFVSRYPEIEPYFYNMLKRADAAPPARGRGARLIRVVPRGFPWLGQRAWASADTYYRQQLAPSFLAAWERAEDADDEAARAR